jgi:arabinogalactan endo-1,4-beta-galactosidase
MDNGAMGMLYWEPGWISGSTMCDLWGQGSSYDDVALFDCAGKALIGWDAFNNSTTGITSIHKVE